MRTYIDEEQNEEVTVTYTREFLGRSGLGCHGFMFDVDADGGFAGHEAGRANWEYCLSGKSGLQDRGVTEVVRRVRLCPCGSLKRHEDIRDARGYFVARVCDDCSKERLSGYRPEIFADCRYEYEGDLEGDEW